MKLTRIHQFEPTSRCNMACGYCPHPHMHRKKEDMSMQTFAKVLEHIRYYYDRGTQPELSITGVGEGLMHPEIINMVYVLREQFPEMELYLSTNGILLDEELCRAFAEVQLNLMVSLHRPEVAGKAIELAKKFGILKYVNDQFVTSSTNWAGTVNWYSSMKSQECQYLAQGWGVILADGSINTCCWDAEGVGIIGHVDDEPGSHKVAPIKLCGTCSLTVPNQYNIGVA